MCKEEKSKIEGSSKLNSAYIETNVELDLQRAVLLHQSGELAQAGIIYKRILDVDPKNVDALHLLGLVSHQSGQSATAIMLIKRALKISPNQPDFLRNLGNILRESGQFEEATRICQYIIQLQPESAEIYTLLGLTLRDSMQLEEAVQAYFQAIRINPVYDDVYNHLGNVLQEQGKLEESIQAYHKAIALNSEYAEAYNNLGIALQKQDKLEESIQVYHRAIEINPGHAEAHNNYGLVLRKQKKLVQAIQSYQIALRINPEYAEAHNNLGLALLLKGDFAQGWREYQWRLKCSAFEIHDRNFPQPCWKGSDINKKFMLIWGEQGVGDQIMFASLISRFQQQAQQVFVETQRRLVPLFKRSFPEVSFFSIQDPPNSRLLDRSIDYQLPMGSLAQWLLPNEESFPKSYSYLKANSDKTRKLKAKYQQLANGKILIGISWKSVNKYIGKPKSTSLIQWRDLLSQEGCFFVNLQYSDVKIEIDAFTNQTGLSIYRDEDIDSLKSLDDFASQVAALDLVISIDNSTVHVAGALGQSVWTLLQYVPDWRWQLDRSDTPWYPSMTLYRQPVLGDWYSVFQQVQVDLQRFVKQFSHANNSDVT